MQQNQTSNQPSVQTPTPQQPAFVVLGNEELSRVVGGMAGPGAGWTDVLGPGGGW